MRYGRLLLVLIVLMFLPAFGIGAGAEREYSRTALAVAQASPQVVPGGPAAVNLLLVRAEVDEDAIPPTLLIEGQGICADPAVSMGTPGGALSSLFVLSSAEGFILAELLDTEPGSYVVVVSCHRQGGGSDDEDGDLDDSGGGGRCKIHKKKSAVIFVTLGAVGPQGLQGEQGLRGPEGPQGPPGAAAFVGLSCPAGWYLEGFDESGSLACAPLVGCGNGVVESGETCDPPGLPSGQPDECREECTFCGDGVVNGDPGLEECDDGNNLGGDGCSSDCLAEAGCAEQGGPCIVFVTTSAYRGDLGGVSGADEKCNARATAGGLPGTYMAWVTGESPDSSPASRFAHSTGPYVLVDGTVVAENWTDLTDGTLAHAIDQFELFGPPPVGDDVWTNTSSSGSFYEPFEEGDGCSGFTDSSGLSGVAGWYRSTSRSWSVSNEYLQCNQFAHLYCFQQ